MNQTEEFLRRGMRTLADEAPIVSELDRSRTASTRRLHGVGVPIMAAAIAAVFVIAVVLASQVVNPSSSGPPASNDFGLTLQLDSVASYKPYGVDLETELRSQSPIRVTGASMDSDLVSGDPSGELWDSTVPDPDVGFEYVDIGGRKPVSLNFGFLPRCDASVPWDEVALTIETDNGTRRATVSTPKLPEIVEEWCALPMQVRTGNGSASANWCEVERDFHFVNPSGEAATVRLSSSGWDAEPLTFAAGEYEAIMIVSSDRACDLPREPTEFTVDYADGRVVELKGPTPTQDM